jgi:AbrB family looped-hinge helix DNA binding protein
MSTATLSSKGQLVIPSEFRNALHLQTGDKLLLSLENGKLVMQRAESPKAKLITDRKGRKVLKAASAAPAMTPEAVKAILADFP